VLLLSTDDASLGPLAEAIAHRRLPLRCSITSAGIAPAATDPRLVSFLASRGIELVRSHPRSLAEVGPFEDFNVVVLLSREAEDACPTLPYKTIALAWDIADPAKIEGSPGEIESAWARAYADVDQKLGDLVAALHGDTPETPELL
jgi:protein-tyrosine-phosphatase